jgi:hypothetical protein
MTSVFISFYIIVVYLHFGFQILNERYVKHFNVCNNTWPCATTNKHTTSSQTKWAHIPIINYVIGLTAHSEAP